MKHNEHKQKPEQAQTETFLVPNERGANMHIIISQLKKKKILNINININFLYMCQVFYIVMLSLFHY
jgi:hypothetical protein